MIGGKIELHKLKNVIQKKKNKAGEMIDCIVIPIAANNLFYNPEKGTVYLDIIGFDAPKPEFNQTHALKQSLPKEVRDKMSEEERKTSPFIGHLNTNIGGGNSAPNNPAPGVVLDEGDEVPF